MRFLSVFYVSAIIRLYGAAFVCLILFYIVVPAGVYDKVENILKYIFNIRRQQLCDIRFPNFSDNNLGMFVSLVPNVLDSSQASSSSITADCV